MHQPSKRGDYIVIAGKLWRVSTRPEQRRGAAALTLAGRKSASVTHWDGSEWSETGYVIHASS
jgi:hypothetical protein